MNNQFSNSKRNVPWALLRAATKIWREVPVHRIVDTVTAPQPHNLAN
jgi:hypothetical protein